MLLQTPSPSESVRTTVPEPLEGFPAQASQAAEAKRQRAALWSVAAAL